VRNLIQLFVENSQRERSFSVQALDDGLHVYIYDVIGGLFWGVEAESLVKELQASTASTIHVHINSPGGDVFDGRAIASALAAHPAEVVAHIEGLAASAASTIALAANRVEIAAGAFLMIHNGWTGNVGDRHTMRQVADLLEKIDAAIAADYVARSGESLETVQQWMDDETWFTAEEAVEQGFADEVIGSARQAANRWSLSAYANAPEIAPTEPTEPDESERRLAEARSSNERRLALFDRCAA
jgi:ATP-dependent Clp protease protease subunit